MAREINTEESIMLAADWFNYLVGPTGFGPNDLLSKKPTEELTEEEKTFYQLDESVKFEKERRRKAFAEAVKEVTGEDIDL